MRLWGKSVAELDAERKQMIARRELLAQRDRQQRALLPSELGERYADRLGMKRVPIPARNTDSTGQYVIQRDTYDPARERLPLFFGAVVSAFICGLMLGSLFL